MDLQKKNIELIVLEQFRKHYTTFPKGRLYKSESPDFILKIRPGYSIGIELTALPSHSYSINEQNIKDFIKDLHHSILKKEEKLEIYQKCEANDFWLLVYADSIITQNSEIEKGARELSINQHFDRIFLFELFDGKIWDF